MTTTVCDRRDSTKKQLWMLKRELNDAQMETLQGLEKFGWELKFVRRKPFEAPVAIVMDGDRRSFAVLELDGTLNENPGLAIRQDR